MATERGHLDKVMVGYALGCLFLHIVRCSGGAASNLVVFCIEFAISDKNLSLSEPARQTFLFIEITVVTALFKKPALRRFRRHELHFRKSLPHTHLVHSTEKIGVAIGSDKKAQHHTNMKSTVKMI